MRAVMERMMIEGLRNLAAHDVTRKIWWADHQGQSTLAESV